MGLDVCVFRTEKLFQPVARDIFGDIHELATAVITVSGVSFGVLIREKRAHCRHNRGAYDIFACDKFQIILLTVEFFHETVVKFGIEFLNRFQIYHDFSLRAKCRLFIVFDKHI